MTNLRTSYLVFMVLAILAITLFALPAVQQQAYPIDADTFYLATYGNLRCSSELQQRVSVTGQVRTNGVIVCPPDSPVEDAFGNRISIDAPTTSNCEINIYMKPIFWQNIFDAVVPIERCTATGGVISSSDRCEPYQTITASGYGTGYRPFGTITAKFGQEFTYYKVGQTLSSLGGILNFAQDIPIDYEATYTPYQLLLEERGSRLTVVADVEQGCYVPYSVEGQILKDDYKARIEKGKFINFVSAWVVAPVQGNVIDYQNKPAVCAGNMVYPLVQEELENGQSVWIESTNGQIVECCPHQDNCGADFKFRQLTKEGDSCGIFDKQVTSYFPSSTTGFVEQYQCTNGEWVVINKKANDCFSGCGPNEYCNEDFDCLSLGQYITPGGDPAPGATVVTTPEGDQQDLGPLLTWIIIIVVIILVVIVAISIAMKVLKK